MASYKTQAFLNWLATQLAGHTFALHLCTAAPGDVNSLTNEASIANSVHSQVVTLTRTNNTFALTPGTISGLDTAATPYAVLVDRTSDQVLAWFGGLTLDPDGNDINFSQSATLITIS